MQKIFKIFKPIWLTFFISPSSMKKFAGRTIDAASLSINSQNYEIANELRDPTIDQRPTSYLSAFTVSRTRTKKLIKSCYCVSYRLLSTFCLLIVEQSLLGERLTAENVLSIRPLSSKSQNVN